MELQIKRFTTATLLFAAFFTTGGCKQRPSDNDAIRAGILQHLTAVGTLNISAMQMDIRSVSISGNQAHAEVEFRPKTGAAPGTGMQIAYNLEKRDGSWVVLKTQAAGGMIQHPTIDANFCIGCAACTMVCPEGDVLAMLGGKAVIVNGYRCIGHSLCAEVCPVGAITMVMASPSMGADMAYLTPEYETSIKNMFIVGELGGLALIKNAVNQGRDCIDSITNRVMALAVRRWLPGVHAPLIVGAGPAGPSASLRAIETKLNYITIDEGEIGGTVAKYPRQKLVMTSPVEFPMHGKFKKTELSKEELIAFWVKVLERADFKLRQGEKVEDIKKGEDGIFTVTT